MTNLHGFDCPTSIRFGEGAARLAGEVFAGLGVARTLLVTDEGVANAGIADLVAESLHERAIEVVIYADTQENPTTANVADAAVLYGERGCCGLLGVGGGSAMDAAKGVGIVVANGGDVATYTGRDQVPVDLPPLVCVPTTCGTGSEVTFNAVLTDVARHSKLPYVSRRLAPKVALVDPTLVERAPRSVIAATGADALAHAVESYINLAYDPLVGALCIGAIREIGRHLRPAVTDRSADAISHMSIASTMAGLAFNQNANAVVHAASTPVTARFNVPHGVANAVFMVPGLEFCLPSCRERLAEIAVALGAEPTADGAIAAISALLCDIGLPKTMTETGVEAGAYELAIPEMIEDALRSRSIALNPRPVTAADLESIYRAAL